MDLFKKKTTIETEEKTVKTVTAPKNQIIKDRVNAVREKYDFKMLTVNVNFRRLIKSDEFQEMLKHTSKEVRDLFNETK